VIAAMTLAMVMSLQTPAVPAPPCRVGAFDEFAFYPGRWHVTVVARASQRGQWQKNEGTAAITADLMGCAFVERLEATRDGRPLELLSILTYDHGARKWQYTVGDSEHGRMTTYEGRREGDVILLLADLDLPGGRALLRRTLRIESADVFMWESARSVDKGKTWDITTRFEYRRVR
jgi:hypothetical protein